MAIIKCPHCGKMVSDLGSKCPECDEVLKEAPIRKGKYRPERCECPQCCSLNYEKYTLSRFSRSLLSGLFGFLLYPFALIFYLLFENLRALIFGTRYTCINCGKVFRYKDKK